MTYSLSNNCTKNYYNRTLTVQVIVEDVVTWIFLKHSVCPLSHSSKSFVLHFITFAKMVVVIGVCSFASRIMQTLFNRFSQNSMERRRLRKKLLNFGGV